MLASCSSKNKIDDLGGGKTDDAISFSTSVKDSRGTAILDNTGLQAAGSFGVTAFHSATDQPGPYMGAADAGAKIIYKTDKWDYDKPADARYWPDAEASLTFYGYTPVDGTKRGAAPVFTKDGGMVFDNYVVPIAVADQEDFMWAYASKNKTAIPSTGVVMNFNHALVRVNFQACVTTSTLKVDIAENGITICNIKKKGKVTVVPAGTFSWGDPTA
ncbi:MAG: fimbrillin family protein, partial [Mucinivorans sp.]